MYAAVRPRHGRFLAVYLLPRADAPHSRLGLAVPRRVGSAPVRNRIKRRLREIFRLHRHRLNPPHDVVVHVRPAAAQASFHELESEMLRAFAQGGRPRA